MVAVAFVGGGGLHAWVMWTGVVGATLAAVAVPGTLRRVTSTPTLLILTAAAAGSAAFLLLTTYTGWRRYYLPLLPALTVAAALGFDDLRRSVAALAGQVPARCVDAAMVIGMLSVLAAFPRITREKIGFVPAHELGIAPASLQAVASVCLALAVVAGLRSLSRRSSPAATSAPSPR